jgi:hypothetical protein
VEVDRGRTHAQGRQMRFLWLSQTSRPIADSLSGTKPMTPPTVRSVSLEHTPDGDRAVLVRGSDAVDR